MISERTAAVLMAASISRFDDSGVSRRESKPRTSLSLSIALCLAAVAFLVFAIYGVPTA